MRGDDAVQALPEPYVRALHLASGGATDEAIAEALGVNAAAVPALLRLGAAKLEATLSDPTPDRRALRIVKQAPDVRRTGSRS